MKKVEKNIKDIRNAIENDNFEKAEYLFQNYRKDSGQYDDITAILDAGIGEYYSDRLRVWTAIQSGLMFNCRNYELYVMLGNYYLEENLYQSYLCYENALFYCDVSEDREAIVQVLYQLKERYNIAVNRSAIVVLSYNSLEYTKLCIESIRLTTPESAREIIVVDNASGDGSTEWLRKQEDIILIENKKNMGFPGGSNQGIRASSPQSDIFLLNSDTILPANALFWLRMGLYDKEENGMAGSVSNNARNQIVVRGIDDVPGLLAFGEKTNILVKYPYEARLSLIGFALLIKRIVVDKIGLLDERFSPGNYEDTDYSLRVLSAGYKNILCKNSFIVHFGRVSFQKNSMDYVNIYSKNKQKLDKKWGFDVEHYLYPRQELLQMINETTEASLRILDVGCGCGALMGRVKGIYPKSEVKGIEMVPVVAELASHMGEVLCGDIEKAEFLWEGYFDYIIIEDVFEYLTVSENIFLRLGKCLKNSGRIIVGMPNIKHFSVLFPLLKKDIFPYENIGILDRAQVKLYTETEIRKLIIQSGYEIEIIKGIIYDQPDKKEKAIIEVLNMLMEISSRESFLVYQYLFKVKKRGVIQ